MSRLENVALRDFECDSVDVAEQDLADGIKERELSVFLHLHGFKSVTMDGFKVAMSRAWRCDPFSMQKIDDTFYQVFLGNQETVDFVLTHGPWNFENHLVFICPRSRSLVDLRQSLQKEEFLILLTDLPRICYTVEIGKKTWGHIRFLYCYPTS